MSYEIPKYNESPDSPLPVALFIFIVWMFVHFFFKSDREKEQNAFRELKNREEARMHLDY